jgi:excisionase family DNA binding protein
MNDLLDRPPSAGTIGPSPPKPGGLPLAEKLLLSRKEVSLLTGISERTICDYLHTGQIPTPVVIGRSTFWRRADLEAWLKNGCPVTPPSQRLRPAANRRPRRRGKQDS